ncbi:retrovirus-related Pol polyprotein from transposon 17.6, partial [Trichonephila clavipes]
KIWNLYPYGLNGYCSQSRTLSQELGTFVRQMSARTVRRRLQQHRFLARRPWPRLPLPLYHRQKRLHWCYQRRTWVCGWREAIFSDESRFCFQHQEDILDYEKPGLTHVLYHEIDTGDNPPIVSRPYRYDRLKQEILDYHVDKMVKDGTIIPIQSPYASPVVLCRKNNGLHTPPDNPEAFRFAVDYRKLNAITKYPRYPLPLIDDLIMNIPHTGIMSDLDLRSGYFQMAVNPSDVVKTAFVTKNGTYAFRRMPFGLSGAGPNFQKAIDIILKPVIGKFVSVYMDDVIISFSSFTQHVKHLKEVFRLLHEAGLTLNKDKCKFGCEELKYLWV